VRCRRRAVNLPAEAVRRQRPSAVALRRCDFCQVDLTGPFARRPAGGRQWSAHCCIRSRRRSITGVQLAWASQLDRLERHHGRRANHQPGKGARDGRCHAGLDNRAPSDLVLEWATGRADHQPLLRRKRGTRALLSHSAIEALLHLLRKDDTVRSKALACSVASIKSQNGLPDFGFMSVPGPERAVGHRLY